MTDKESEYGVYCMDVMCVFVVVNCQFVREVHVSCMHAYVCADNIILIFTPFVSERNSVNTNTNMKK